MEGVSHRLVAEARQAREGGSMQRLVLPKGGSASRSSPTPTACKKQRLDSVKVPKAATKMGLCIY